MARRESTNQRRFSLVSKTGGSSESIFSFGSSDKLDQQFGSSGSLQKWETEADGDGINVVVRVRPMNAKELKANDRNVVMFPGNGQILLEGLNIFSSENGPKSKLFSFNVVFEPRASQNDVFDYSGIKKLVSMAVQGFNTTCFCYGQTGSGKTHTLTGPPRVFVRKKMDPFSPEHGLVYRSFLHLFQELREKTDVHFVLKASFLEIYNEKVIDLLNPGSNRTSLSVRWSKKTQSFFVENLFTVDCEQLDDLQAVLEEGVKNRSVGSHSLNDCSGRSHTILTVHITSEQQMNDSTDVFITKRGKINFVDLAGSEMSKKTGSSGMTLTEANNINKSLMVLGYCISSLSDPKKRSGHIPYRDSKLTKLLADSLAGSGVTLMIACISPASSNVCETLNTLRYAARAKRIQIKPIVVMDPRETLIVSLKREIEALQKENERLRKALDIHNCYVENVKKSSETYEKLAKLSTVKAEKLAQMSSIELVDLIKHYAADNEALRKENLDLFHSRDLLMRDHEIVCHENERLIKKLENQTPAPIITLTRASHSADPKLSTNATIVTNKEEADTGPTVESEVVEIPRKLSASTTIPNSAWKEIDMKAISKTVLERVFGSPVDIKTKIDDNLFSADIFKEEDTRPSHTHYSQKYSTEGNSNERCRPTSFGNQMQNIFGRSVSQEM